MRRLCYRPVQSVRKRGVASSASSSGRAVHCVSKPPHPLDSWRCSASLHCRRALRTLAGYYKQAGGGACLQCSFPNTTVMDCIPGFGTLQCGDGIDSQCIECVEGRTWSAGGTQVRCLIVHHVRVGLCL